MPGSRRPHEIEKLSGMRANENVLVRGAEPVGSGTAAEEFSKEDLNPGKLGRGLMTEQNVAQNWPALPWKDWEATATTLHLWTQIVGKTRLALTALQNPWWNVPLYLTARGLTTSAMFYQGALLDIEFDFVSHDLHFRISSGANLSVPLRPQSVADFYQEFLVCLKALGVSVEIHPVPVEIPNPIPFAEDGTHASYDADYANRFWRILSATDRLFKKF